MHRYFIVFFAYLFAHTTKFSWVQAVTPSEYSAVLDFDKDGRTPERFAAKVLSSDQDGYKTYTVDYAGNRYLSLTNVYFGEHKLDLDGKDWVVNHTHYVKVFWKGDVAPFYCEVYYYDALWKSWKKYYKLNRELKWEEFELGTQEKTDEYEEHSATYYPSLKARLDKLSAEVQDKLGEYKAFAGAGPAAGEVKEEEKDKKETDKKKYVLMVVVVVVFVVVASLVVFLVKFCLK